MPQSLINDIIQYVENNISSVFAAVWENWNSKKDLALIK
jgi:hypothetical protein